MTTNTQTKFTSGEWKWATGDGTEKDVCITTDERNLSGMGNICELDVFFDGEFGIEQKANANLIAAAPDMYAMLEDSRTMLRAFHTNTGSMGAIAQVRFIDDLLKKARGE
jgi:hypothetical protein